MLGYGLSDGAGHGIITYLDAFRRRYALKRIQTETGAELDALLPAVLDRVLKANCKEPPKNAGFVIRINFNPVTL